MLKRLAVSSIGFATSKISGFLDFYLQPIVPEVPSYVRDTKDFLKQTETVNNVPEETYLVTIDVKCLYTNIPYLEAKRA